MASTLTTPALNLSQTPSSVISQFSGTPNSGAALSSPIYSPGSALNLPTPAPVGQLDTSSPQKTLAGIEQQQYGAYQQGVDANMDLLNTIQGGYQNLYQSQTNALAGYGTSQQNALNSQYAALSAQNTQQGISSGLNNTTVTDSLQQGTANAKALASTDLAGQLQQYLQQTQQGIATADLGFLGGTNLQYPTLQNIGSEAIAGQTAANSTPPNPYLLAGAQGLAGGLGQYLGGGNSGNGGAIGSAVAGLGSLIGSLL